MVGPLDVRSRSEREQPVREPPGLDFGRLFGRASVEEALTEVARWLAPDVVEFVLSPGSLAPVTCSRRKGSAPVSCVTAVVPGDPPWRCVLAVVEGCGSAPEAIAERAGSALGAWRAARAVIERTERHLTARSRELELLSDLGRRASEARDLNGLFASAVAVLSRALELDLALAAWQEAGRVTIAGFPARPFTPDCSSEIERRALGFLGVRGGMDVERFVERLDIWDAERGPRSEFREEDLVLLPLLRRGKPVACIVAVAAGEIDESRLRPLHGAASLLTLHLERIFGVREAEADRFRSVVDSMPQGVVLADPRLRPIQMNESAARMLEGLEMPQDGDSGSVLKRVGVAELAARVAAGEPGPLEAEVCPGGERVWSVTVSAFARERGVQDGIVIVMADVTDRRRMQEQLAQSEKMSSLGQLISGVAHELNNPLASILGYAQLLRMKGQEERLGDRLDILVREAERCRKIVQSLLSFARCRAAERRPFCLNQVVRDVHALLAYQLRVNDVAVELELDPDLSVMHGDPHQLEQVLVNLLTNARHAIRDTGRPGTVTVKTRRRGPGAVMLLVRDTGPGIPPEVRPRIFDPFFTTKRPGQGTGLGLALAYSIVTAHGGTIEVHSPSGGGTLFEIVLPFGLPARAHDAVPPAAPSAAAPGDRRGRILVIDDEQAIARMICDALEHDGHSASSVADGRQALERVREEEFDLVVSDVRMPGIEGDRLLEELRVLRPRLARRMLLTTGDTVGAAAEEIAARTGFEVLAKPFDLADLRRRVHARLASED